MNTLILPEPKNAAAKQLIGFLDKLRSFLPAGINPEQFFAACLTEINQLPADCDARSVLMTTVNAAIIGLLPGPFLGHCHFIPFYFHKGQSDEKRMVQLIVGYKGFLELAFSNDFLSQCNPEVLLKGEQFTRWHDENGPHIRHDLPRNRKLQKTEVEAAYCTYKTTAGGSGIAMIERMELDRLDTGQNVWASDYLAMARKSAIRRAAKEWRLSDRMARAVMVDEEADRGLPQSCPELIEDQTPDPIGNTRRTFDMTLNHMVGCQDAADRDRIVAWAAQSELDYATATKDQTAMENVLNALRQRQKEGMPWDSMLNQSAASSTSAT